MKNEPSPTKNAPFAFGKRNYQLMFVGLGILLVGFIVMTLDQEPHGFGFLGLTLGPIIVMVGFLFQFIAIFAKDKQNPSSKM